MKKFTAVLMAALLLATPANAQISIPNTFVANTRIISADVNENFTELGDKALNRTGGTMTGDLVISTTAKPDVDGGADIGTAILRFGTFYVENIDVESGLVVETLTVSDVGAASIDTAGGITAGSGSVPIIDGAGRIPEISSTYFASLSGQQLTGILETGIADGAIFPRVASAETITAQWTFEPSGAPALFKASAATSNLFAGFGRASDEQSRILFLSSGGSNQGAIQADTDIISILVGAGLGAIATFSPTTINMSVSGNLNFAGTGITNSGTYNSGTTQPGFAAYSELVPTPAHGADIVFGTEIYDTGGVYNNATGIFTAPLTGTYLICYNAPVGTGSTDVYIGLSLVVAGNTYNSKYWNSVGGTTREDVGACVVVPMTATNTAYVEAYDPGGAGLVVGDNIGRDSFFSARLVP